MKHPDMIAGLDWDIILTISGKGFECLAVSEDIDVFTSLCAELKAFVERKAANEGTGRDEQIAEALDMLEGGFDIFKVREHINSF